MRFVKHLTLLALLTSCTLHIFAADYNSTWDKSLKWLTTQANPDGSFGKYKGAKVGYSGLILQAWANAPQSVKKANPVFAAIMQKNADWIAAKQNPTEGYIADGPQYHNYSTAIAVAALADYDEKKYAPLIKKGVAYLKRLQADETRNFDPKKHITYGGFGYGSTLRPDLSNTWFALSAIKSAGGNNKQVFKKAIVFIQRCQNSTEINDQAYATNDGGAMYLPGDSAAGNETSRSGKKTHKSFGSMTAAMLSSYLTCGLSKDSKQVALAAKWLGEHFSVTANPNHQKNGQQALYYYYRALATALTQYGESDFFGHKWKQGLARELRKKQSPEGFWQNKESRFSENDPVLCTAYALYALGECSK